jgi:uncharacterized protein (TIGR03435 family)
VASSVARTNLPTLCGPSSVADAAAPSGVPNWADKLRGVAFDPNGPLPIGTTLKSGRGGVTTLRGITVPIADLLSLIQSDVDRPIIDHTGLKGLFDFRLEYRAEQQAGARTTIVPSPQQAGALGAASDPFPSLETVMQQHLGLKLEPTKGPVDVLVIADVRKPGEN